MDRMSVTVIQPGILVTIQDLGRPGFRQSGVSPGGAVDAHALRIANMITGNEDSAAGLEITLGKLRLRFFDERGVAWCGGGASDVKIGELMLPAGRACFVAAGEELQFMRARSGCRAWLALLGGARGAPLVRSRGD